MAEDDADFLNIKLEFLKKKTRRLHESVDDLVNEVSSACQTWLEVGENKKMSFAEINWKLEHCVTYVTRKSDQILEETSGGRGLTVTEMPLETNPISASPSQTSASTSQLQPAVSCQESGYVKKFLSRLETTEMALSSIHSVTEKLSQNQTKVETQVQEIKQKQSEMEEVTTKHLADTEKQLKKANKRSEGMKQQEKKVASLETQIQDMKKQDKRLDSIEKEMKTMSSNQSELETKAFVKIASVEKQIETNTDLTYHLKAGIESVSNKTEANESSIQEVTARLEITETKAVENKSLIDEANLKTRNLTKKINKYQKDTLEKLQEVKKGYGMVCAMVANRLLALEKLRKAMNKNVENREDNVKKLGDFCNIVTSLQEKVSDLEEKISTRVGFSAYFGERCPVPNAGAVIKSFTDIKCNLGNHFDPSTGIFTAPASGIYVVNVTLWQMNEGDIVVLVQRNQGNPGSNDADVKWVSNTGTRKDSTSSSGFGVVDLAAGDQLYVEVFWKTGHVYLDFYSSFSCFLMTMT